MIAHSAGQLLKLCPHDDDKLQWMIIILNLYEAFKCVPNKVSFSVPSEHLKASWNENVIKLNNMNSYHTINDAAST